MIILLPDGRLHSLLKSIRSCLPFHALCLVNIFEIDFVFTSFSLSPGKPFARLLTHFHASVVWIYYPFPSLNIWGTFLFPFSPPLPSLASPPPPTSGYGLALAPESTQPCSLHKVKCQICSLNIPAQAKSARTSGFAGSWEFSIRDESALLAPELKTHHPIYRQGSGYQREGFTALFTPDALRARWALPVTRL